MSPGGWQCLISMVSMATIFCSTCCTTVDVAEDGSILYEEILVVEERNSLAGRDIIKLLPPICVCDPISCNENHYIDGNI